ncbi:glucuronosyltransferase [Rhizobium sp. Leaf384]|uniref:glycosyltransferase n=1 Tax=unclassified Rhizobium TaxID=2613769 RepID=UPI0007155C4D|nr:MULTISPECIES: glycosyltransferase [unclassified Rhizobium]KQS80562.1 glucuronosyltransferase [Rhizobium sp. Leaf384]KQS82205.1 glucuronosyltransferase [Rhizobium sp. Leaf383]
MIIVSVGTQLPFDRLIRMVDDLAPSLHDKAFAQTGRGVYVPKNIEWKADVPAKEFDALLSGASVLVAHAGIGTVLKADQYGKPIILVPRKASLGEHRNDHQLATVSKLKGRPGIYVAEEQDELLRLLSDTDSLSRPSALDPPGRIRLQSHLEMIVNGAIGAAR